MDDIVLPPIPKAVEPMHSEYALKEYARAAVIADRKRRAKPEQKRAHQAMVYLGNGGQARICDSNETVAGPTIRWTDDGRVWIESRAHRGVASDLRRATMWLRSQDAHVFAAACARAADLLDGGQPC